MSIEKVESFSGVFGFLSNFRSPSVTFEGMTFKTVEHAYQAAKTLDINERREIQSKRYPGGAKKHGHKVTMRDDWHDIKLEVMETLLRQKFANPYYRDLLLCTEDLELIEGNTWGDTFWGVCKGVGENHLGKLLMKIRNDIK